MAITGNITKTEALELGELMYMIALRRYLHPSRIVTPEGKGICLIWELTGLEKDYILTIEFGVDNPEFAILWDVKYRRQEWHFNYTYSLSKALSLIRKVSAYTSRGRLGKSVVFINDATSPFN